jgi:hypothetical protein
LIHGAGERAKHGDLFSARGAQVFFEQRAPVTIEAGCRCQHLLRVDSCLNRGIDPLDAQPVGRLFGQCVRKMGRGLGGGEGHGMAAIDQADGQCRGKGGLANPALSHREDDAVAGRVQATRSTPATGSGASRLGAIDDIRFNNDRHPST